MLKLDNYEIYIFDCDGVILDSNRLKIDAMKSALIDSFDDLDKVENCIEYFKNNFGKSRFNHVDYFIDQVFVIKNSSSIKNKVLKFYSDECRKLYMDADLTPGFIGFIDKLKGTKYVASGSEEEELRYVFKVRGLDVYFENIYGSPTSKVSNVKKILDERRTKNAIMFGDSISDLEAAIDNKINFIAYVPFSNVQGTLIEKTEKSNFNYISDWSELC
jgi:phosphoglycolate phosphatase-like HAD superfamily hydrolase